MCVCVCLRDWLCVMCGAHIGAEIDHNSLRSPRLEVPQLATVSTQLHTTQHIHTYTHTEAYEVGDGLHGAVPEGGDRIGRGSVRRAVVPERA